MKNKLQIIAGDGNSQSSQTKPTGKNAKRQELQAKFDQKWLENPRQFDPERNCIERERLQRTWNLLIKHAEIKDKRAVDLGCGGGDFAKMLAGAGAKVDAVDVSGNALKIVQLYNCDSINTLQDVVPETKLADDQYDLVISTELLGYLPQHERRLYFAELSRLVKPDGFVICSTSLDIYTEDALQNFGTLVESEFHPKEWLFSYHALLIRIKNFFEMPGRFARGHQDSEYRIEQINARSSFSQWWYKVNSSKILGPFWKLVQAASTPLANIFKDNRALMLNFEKICRFISNEAGISHVIFIGQRRPLIFPTKEELMAFEPKHKRQVWE